MAEATAITTGGDATSTDGATTTDDAQTDDDGAGSKEAVLADLAKERDKRQAAEKESKRLKGIETELEKAVAKAKSEGFDEGVKHASGALLRAEVRAAAGPLLADPEDAVRLLDLDSYTPNAEGEFDRKAISVDVAALVKSKPYLSQQPGNGAGEGGPRGSTTASSGTTNDPLLADVQRMAGIKP